MFEEVTVRTSKMDPIFPITSNCDIDLKTKALVVPLCTSSHDGKHASQFVSKSYMSEEVTARTSEKDPIY